MRQQTFKKGSQKLLQTAFENILRRVLRRCLTMGFRVKNGSEKGS